MAEIVARFEVCTEESPPITLIDMASEPGAGTLAAAPPGWQPVGASGDGIVLWQDDDSGSYWTNTGAPRNYELRSRHQGWPDTEVTFSYRFGPGAHPKQAVAVQTRNVALSGASRVALQIYPEKLQLVNNGGVHFNTHNITVPRYHQRGVWYDALVKTFDDKCYVWVRQQPQDPENPAPNETWDYHTVYTEPSLRSDSLLDEAEEYIPLHTEDSEYLLAGFLTFGYNNPGQLQLKDLKAESYVCDEVNKLGEMPFEGLSISEVVIHNMGPLSDNRNSLDPYQPWIEIYNPTESDIDI